MTKISSGACWVGIALALSVGVVQAQDESAGVSADPMAFVRGAQAWGNTCARCHGMRDAKEFDDAQWQVIMTHMRARAGLTGSDSRDILLFLQQSN